MMATIGLTPNPPLISGVPTHCAHCKQPFRSVNGRVKAWRSSTGKYFCNEFCAEDDEEATRFHRSLPADHPSLLQHCRGWATRLSEARHDEAERKFAADEEKREKYVRGWGVRTIYENIAGLFPVKL